MKAGLAVSDWFFGADLFSLPSDLWISVYYPFGKIKAANKPLILRIEVSDVSFIRGNIDAGGHF